MRSPNRRKNDRGLNFADRGREKKEEEKKISLHKERMAEI